MVTTNSGAAESGEADAPGEAQLLVSEFPPPPFYYKLASANTIVSASVLAGTSHSATTNTATNPISTAISTVSQCPSPSQPVLTHPTNTLPSRLVPPSIPTEALERGTRRAAAAAAQARAESVRIRLGEDMCVTNSDAILGGTTAGAAANSDDNEDDVIAVFGEIVEDPYLVEVLDLCEDPIKIRDEVHRLNREVVQLFVGLVKDLVNRPLENKKRRDELSHNTFLMLQECNKFREHQAREVLIELLERQLVGRRDALAVLKEQVQMANEILGTVELGL